MDKIIKSALIKKVGNATEVKTLNSKRNLNSRMALLTVITIVFAVLYMTLFVDMKYVNYAMQIRTPKLITMAIAAFCIGAASMVFQSIIKNRIVTPCLLGMNSLYILIHTTVAFIFGSASIFSANKNVSFMLDVVLMAVIGTVIYGFLFKKTNYNILYVLLAGTVLATFFTSLSNTMVRTMDPNEYDKLLSSLVAGFDHVNADIIYMALGLIVFTLIFFWKDVKLLDAITLGKNQAINLGVDYDKTIRRLLIAVTFFITIATALVGPISFLGLIIANLSREFFKTYKHSYLMMGSFLMGTVILFGGQILIEHVFGFGTQISVFINFFGGIYFLYLVLKNKGA